MEWILFTIGLLLGSTIGVVAMSIISSGAHSSLDNEIIRQDTLVKTILGVPQLIDSNKIAKADRDDQRKD